MTEFISSIRYRDETFTLLKKCTGMSFAPISLRSLSESYLRSLETETQMAFWRPWNLNCYCVLKNIFSITFFGTMKICRITIHRIAVLPKICSVESPFLPKIHSVESLFLPKICSVESPFLPKIHSVESLFLPKIHSVELMIGQINLTLQD